MLMRKIRGFKLGKRLVRVSKWIIRKTRIRPGYQRLSTPEPQCKAKNSICKILTWGRRLTNGARSICAAKPGSGYVPLGSEPIQEKTAPAVPKGHLAVYVGQKDGDCHRVLVPVIYFNHPLFGELLREAEEEYGYQHQGGITIPCRFTEFEQVKTLIASSDCGGGGGGKLKWRRHF